MANIRDVIRERQKSNEKFAGRKTVTSGITVNIDNPNTPDVSGRPGFVWVRENAQDGGIFQCFNPVVKNVGGLPVIISRGALKSSMRMIEGIDWSSLAVVLSDTEGVALQIPSHHRDHEWPDMYPGLDVVHVYTRAIVPCGIYIGSLPFTISVAPGKYIYGGNVIDYVGLTNADISSYIPITAGNYVAVLVYINPATNLVEYLVGDEAVGPTPVLPAIAISTFPIAYIVLYEGMTALTDSDIVEDTRPIFTVSDITEVPLTLLNERLALMEAEWDYELTRHVVEG